MKIQNIIKISAIIGVLAAFSYSESLAPVMMTSKWPRPWVMVPFLLW